MSKKYLENLHWRAAIKMFDNTKTLTNEQLNMLVETARLTPTSYGLQPLRLKVLNHDDSKLRDKLKNAAYGQSQVTDASHLFIFLAKQPSKELVNDYMERLKNERGVTDEDIAQYRDMMLNTIETNTTKQLMTWAEKQVYIALGFVMDAAAQNGIDSCPMEGFDSDKFNELLELDSDLNTVVLLPVGFRSEQDQYSKMTKVRLSKDKLVI